MDSEQFENWNHPVSIQEFILVIGKTIKNMVKENNFTKTEYILDIGKMAKDMELELCGIRMVSCI